MDVFEQLADVTVPPVPAPPTFTAGVRRKLYPRLLALHVVEFALGATVWAAGWFCLALFAALRYTVTGSWPRSRGQEETRGDAH
ncbi:MAG: hypothetical protein EBR23_12675 [Planctomycetia bacterium]|nr:hypothetical protein [Planctomycetia bacterium]